MGRPKVERPTTNDVAARVLAKENAEITWRSIIQLEKRRLGLNPDGTLQKVPTKKYKSEDGDVIDGPDYQGKFSIIPLVNTLRYLEDRVYGSPVDNINHMHDKPIEMKHELELGEGLKEAMKKADERLLKLHGTAGRK